jgi:hypothetical protein
VYTGQKDKKSFTLFFFLFLSGGFTTASHGFPTHALATSLALAKEEKIKNK